MADGRGIKILFVEDVPTDIELAERELIKNGVLYEAVSVETESGFRSALDYFIPDVVISDYSMPLFDGMAALLIARDFDPFMPFIVLTGSMNEDTAVACMKAGASDYVIKEHMSRLSFSVREAIERKNIQQKSVEQEVLLRQSEERYRSIFANSNAVMLIIDPSGAVITDANNAAVNFYGWPRETLIGKGLSEINTLSQDEVREEIRQATQMKKKYFQFKHRIANGSVVEVEVYSGPISIGDQICLLSIIHDISKRIAFEAERDALALKLSHYLSKSPTITYSMRLDGSVAVREWISENVVNLLGYALEEAMEPDWWFRNISAVDRADALKGIAALARNGTHCQEYRFIKKDHSVVWIRDDMRLVKNKNRATEIVGTMTDISGKKRAEAEISLKSAALEAADNAVVITDRDGRIEWVNSAFGRLTGYVESEAIGKNLLDLVESGHPDPEFYHSLWGTILSGRVWHGEIINKRKTGELYHEEMTITPVLNSVGRIEHFISIKSDVTQEVLSKERLELSLCEKEELLREIHHRVKNNMQVITSLLNLSAESIEDPSLKRSLAEVMRRIEAMAIVHDQFYGSEDLARIDFSLYLRQLVDSLIDGLDVVAEPPELIYEAEETKLNLEAAIPAGLIVSEFVSNSLGFAYVNAGQPGVLKISVHRKNDGFLEIEVRDNGVGLPAGFDPKKSRSLGMQLIGILADQLHGTVSFNMDGGTVAGLRFPYTDA